MVDAIRMGMANGLLVNERLVHGSSSLPHKRIIIHLKSDK